MNLKTITSAEYGETVSEAEAMQLTGYKRTTLYLKRRDGLVRWTPALSGRKIRYNYSDLLKLIGC